jgi:hypothetical protein
MARASSTVTPIKPVETIDTGVPETFAVSPMDLPSEVFQQGIERRKANRSAILDWLRSALVEGVDFGTIKTKRGPSKPSLFKAGSEKICGMLGVTVRFPNLSIYDAMISENREISCVILRCELLNSASQIVSEGMGARSVKQDFGDLNKSLKMAGKSAQIDATLRLAGLSEVFSQDLEDLADNADDPPSQSIPRITADQIRQVKALLYSNRVHSGRFYSWLSKFCSANGYGEVDEVSNIPESLFTKVCDKIRNDFADTAGAPVNSNPTDQE